MNKSVVSITNKKTKFKTTPKKKVTDKYFAALNNNQFNIAIEYVDATKTMVKNFSIGFVLKELSVNTLSISNPEKNQDNIHVKSELKNSTSSSSLSLYYVFLNNKRYDLLGSSSSSIITSKLFPSNKVLLSKHTVINFYDFENLEEKKMRIKAEKAAEILLLFLNFLKQAEDIERNIKIMKSERKKNPFNEQIKAIMTNLTEQKSKLKETFIDMVKNMLKRYF